MFSSFAIDILPTHNDFILSNDDTASPPWTTWLFMCTRESENNPQFEIIKLNSEPKANNSQASNLFD